MGAACSRQNLCLLPEVRARGDSDCDSRRFRAIVPGSETLVVRTDTNPTPIQYVVTETTVVDESGAPIAINQIALGVPLSVQYTTTGDRLVASRVIVQQTPVAATGPGVSQERTTTTTSETRPLTHDEREALEEREEHRKERLKEEAEKRKEALEKAKEAFEDDDGGGD